MTPKQLQHLFLVTLIVIIVDRLTKNLAVTYLESPIQIIPSILYLQFSWNSGMAFGMFSEFSNVLTVLIAVIIFVILVQLPKIPSKFYTATALILGGAVGNLIDRFIYGQVADFIFVRGFSIFNIADVAITLGVLLVFWHTYEIDKKLNKLKRKS